MESIKARCGADFSLRNTIHTRNNEIMMFVATIDGRVSDKTTRAATELKQRDLDRHELGISHAWFGFAQ